MRVSSSVPARPGDHGPGGIAKLHRSVLRSAGQLDPGDRADNPDIGGSIGMGHPDGTRRLSKEVGRHGVRRNVRGEAPSID